MSDTLKLSASKMQLASAGLDKTDNDHVNDQQYVSRKTLLKTSGLRKNDSSKLMPTSSGPGSRLEENPMEMDEVKITETTEKLDPEVSVRKLPAVNSEFTAF
jgi:hypothetical protein